MMYGTIEIRKDSDKLSKELTMPAWMQELTFEEMTDEQRKELEEFNAMQKALEEEREKHRKALELELKKLRIDVNEVCKAFDEKVKEIADYRVLTMNVVVTQELYMIRLAVGLMEREDAKIQMQQLQTSLVTAEEEKVVSSTRFDACQAQVDEVRDRIAVLQEEDKLLERNFRREIQEASPNAIDQDSLKVLQTLYRLRTEPTADDLAITRAAPGEGEEGAAPLAFAFAENDPFSPVDEKTATDARAKQLAQQIVPLSAETDCPDGFKVEDVVWERLQRLRVLKMQKEIDIQNATNEQNSLKAQQQELNVTLTGLATTIGTDKDQHTGLRESTELSERNLECLVSLKQGQDEVEQEAVVTDYGDAMLVPITVINEVNTEIQRLGAEQVRILNKIKNFRKSINLMEWEHQYMLAKSHDLEEHYTDLQLLRVTKNLQSVMQGDQRNRDRERAEKAEKRVSIMGRVHADKVSKYQKANAKLGGQVRERQEENARLGQQLKELQSSVAVRESIFRSRVESSGGEVNPAQQAANRMKRVTMRRRLIDLARLQTEEIDFMRQELDRLRQRTFPSFAHAARNRLAVPPDEII